MPAFNQSERMVSDMLNITVTVANVREELTT